VKIVVPLKNYNTLRALPKHLIKSSEANDKMVKADHLISSLDIPFYTVILSSLPKREQDLIQDCIYGLIGMFAKD